MNQQRQNLVTSKPPKLLEGVHRAYSAAAESPQDEHPFPLGRDFATSLGYPLDLLDDLPSVAVDVFTGVSNVSVFAEIPPGATVLDLGCGGGLDTLIAAQRTGVQGNVVGVDFGDAMLTRARQAVQESGIVNVVFHQGEAAAIPVGTGSIDVALANGIFNLNPDRTGIFRELARVLRPGGKVYVAELILREALAAFPKVSESSWFA